MKKTLFFFCLIYLYSLNGQNKSGIDSLLIIIKSKTNDSNKVEAYNKLSKLNYFINFNKSLEYNETAIDIAKEINFVKGLADAYNIQGVIYINQAKNNEALISLGKSVELQKQINNKRGLAAGYGNIGGLYFSISDYNKALYYHIESLKINESLNNKSGIGNSLINIGNIYFMQKKFSHAKMYYGNAQKIYHELKDLTGETTICINLGGVYLIENNLALAVTYFENAKRLSESTSDDRGLAAAYGGLGDIYTKKKEFDKAHFCYDKCHKLNEKFGDVVKCTENDGQISNLYLAEKKYPQAIEFGKKYLLKARELGARQYERDALEYLFEGFAGLNNFEEAYKYHLKYSSLKDSILNAENFKSITEMQTKYETEKKDKQNLILITDVQAKKLQLNRNLYLTVGLIGLIILLTVSGFLIIRQNKLKSEQRSIQLEQKLLRTQMNPHFIFNSLIAIESYIYDREPEKAGAYLSGFAQLMRQTLENSREEYVTLEMEIAILKNYLSLQQLRYEDRFTYSINVSDELEELNFRIPPMLTQPFIENAIEHGFSNKTKTGKIEVNFRSENETLVVEVIDNGVGIYHSEKQVTVKPHKSLALSITKERLALLNKGARNKILLTIKELTNTVGESTGTGIYFVIPAKA